MTVNEFNILKTVLESRTHTTDDFEMMFFNTSYIPVKLDVVNPVFNIEFKIPKNTSWCLIKLESMVWDLLDYYSQLTSVKIFESGVVHPILHFFIGNKKLETKDYFLSDDSKEKIKEIISKPIKISRKNSKFSFEFNLIFYEYKISVDENVTININYNIPEIRLKPNDFRGVIKITKIPQEVSNILYTFFKEREDDDLEDIRLGIEDDLAGEVLNNAFGLNYMSDSYLSAYVDINKICDKKAGWSSKDMKVVNSFFEEIISESKDKLSESFKYSRY